MSTATAEPLVMEAPAEEESQVLQRRRMPEDAEIDMTPMIDCVFLLNIFFILTYNADPAQSANLAPAVTGRAIDPATSVVVTIAESPQGTPLVYLGQGKQGTPLPADENSQREILLRYLQEGRAAGKTQFAIEAERGIKEGDVDRVASVINDVEGMTLFFPVQEIDK